MNQASPNTNTAQPNILFIFADNLGWGELGCYGGGELRGAPTPRIDELAQEGLRFLNFNVESDCVPTRSALMTGRHPIRTGALGSGSAGIIPWEITLSQLLSDQGYATGIFGKWHLGDTDSRLPHRRGFEEWYGIPRTTNESMFTDALGFDPSVSFIPVVMEAEAGKTATELGVYDLEMRRLIDAEITRRTIDFCQRTVSQGRRFFAYVPLTQLHFPTLPHHDFAGQTGAGDFADSMVEMDHRVGQMLDCIEELGVAEDTLVLFGSDNGPEFRRPWRGTAGPWQGTYHSAMEGGLRVPFMIRWPGLIEPGQVTNEMVHIVDLFSTLARIGGAPVPTDRPIDGIDQQQFFLGKEAHSQREGFVFYIRDEVRAAKWRNWKMHYIWEPEPNDGPKHLESPFLFNLLQDPKEETSIAMEHTWVARPMRRLVNEMTASLRRHPPIPAGAPDDHVPA